LLFRSNASVTGGVILEESFLIRRLSLNFNKPALPQARDSSGMTNTPPITGGLLFRSNFGLAIEIKIFLDLIRYVTLTINACLI
jgi:hypothetical protein